MENVLFICKDDPWYYKYISKKFKPIYNLNQNPLTWLDTMLNAVEHMNFFEGRATEYSKASTKGTWSEAFS